MTPTPSTFPSLEEKQMYLEQTTVVVQALFCFTPHQS